MRPAPRRMRPTLAALAATAGLALGAAAAPARAADEPFRMMAVEEVAKGIAAKELHLFDANSAETYAQGHVPGARFVAYRTFGEQELPADKGAKLVFYCKNPH